jgi:hypothetical protein
MSKRQLYLALITALVLAAAPHAANAQDKGLCDWPGDLPDQLYRL